MTTKGKEQINWTADEDSILRENYPKMMAKELTKLLPGRSHISIEKRVERLGIQKRKLETVGYKHFDIEEKKENFFKKLMRWIRRQLKGSW